MKQADIKTLKEVLKVLEADGHTGTCFFTDLKSIIAREKAKIDLLEQPFHDIISRLYEAEYTSGKWDKESRTKVKSDIDEGCDHTLNFNCLCTKCDRVIFARNECECKDVPYWCLSKGGCCGKICLESIDGLECPLCMIRMKS